MDIKQRFTHFIARIRPSREQLTERIAGNGQFHLEKTFRAGSIAKHTDLGRTEKV